VAADGHRSLNDPYRRKTQKFIDLENAHLVRRILSTGSSFDRRGENRDFQRHKRTVHLLQRLPDTTKKSRQPRSLPPLRPPRPSSTAPLPIKDLEALFMPGELRRSATGGDLGTYAAAESTSGGGGLKALPAIDPYCNHDGGEFYSSANEEMKRRYCEDSHEDLGLTLGVGELENEGSPSHMGSADLGPSLGGSTTDSPTQKSSRSSGSEGVSSTVPISEVIRSVGGASWERSKSSFERTREVAAAPPPLGDIEALRCNSGAFSPQRDELTERRKWLMEQQSLSVVGIAADASDPPLTPGGGLGHPRHNISGMSSNSELQIAEDWDEYSFSAASPSRGCAASPLPPRRPDAA
jgi:hypothetical protein